MSPLPLYAAQSETATPFFFRLPRSPMDLVCRRVARVSHARRSTADTAFQFADTSHAHEFRVTLPNPRYPLPAPPWVRHHAQASSAVAAAWGADGDTLGRGADLALTVMAAFLPFRMNDHQGAMRARDGTLISRRAEQYHRAFNDYFLVTMPAEGSVVEATAIRAWIEARELIDSRCAA